MNIAGVGPTMIPEEVAKRCSMMSLTFGKKYGKTFCWVYFITYLTSASSSQPGECACLDLEKEDGGYAYVSIPPSLFLFYLLSIL